MHIKKLCLIGLLLLIISQALFCLGFDFLINQKPIDFTHWILLFASVFLLSFNFVFPKGIINSISISLTTLGVISHIGMCAIDFVLWSYGDDIEGRNELVVQLMNTTSVWLPFMIVGPSLLYIGLTTHAWKFIRSHTAKSILTLLGGMIMGYGQFSGNRILILIASIALSAGLILLIYRNENKSIT